MIEPRGLPRHQRVTRSAVADAAVQHELLAVDVFVAAFAVAGRIAEHHFLDSLSEIRRLVAFQASRGTMRALQLELGGVVIESSDFLPGPQAVARFAFLQRRAFELPLVRIAMAFDASQRIEMILHRSVRGRGFVATLARCGRMSAAQRELRLLMLSLGVSRRPESIDV